MYQTEHTHSLANNPAIRVWDCPAFTDSKVLSNSLRARPRFIPSHYASNNPPYLEYPIFKLCYNVTIIFRQVWVMARKTITDQQRAKVLELKRRHSYNEVAAITGLPLGTVRTIVRRSGTLSDNPKHRLMFTLPAIKHSASSSPTNTNQWQVLTG